MSAGRNQQITRQWRLLRMMEARTSGVSFAEDYPDPGKNDRRYFYRDIEALQDAGFPIVSTKEGGQSRWGLVDGWRKAKLPPLRISEIMALRIMRGAVRSESAAPFQEAFAGLIEKLDAGLPPKMHAYVKGLDQVLAGDPLDQAVDQALLETYQDLGRACVEHLRVKMCYRSGKGEASQRTVDPYTLWSHRGSAYLYCYCHLREAVRTFKLSRIQSLEITADSFEPNPAYDHDEYSRRRFRIMGDGTLHDVAILFAPEAATYVSETRWHGTQRIEEEAGGSITLYLRTSGLSEIATWIMSFGPRARALAPQLLVDDIRAQLKAALAGYGGRGVSDVRPARSAR